MPDAIEALAEGLRSVVANHASRSDAADALAARARAGEDIEAAMPALELTLEEANQIGLLDVAADAVALHLLKRSEPDRLLELAGRLRWGETLWAGLERAVEVGVCLDPLLLCLQPGETPKQRDKQRILGRWLKKNPDQRTLVADRLIDSDPDLFLGLFFDLLGGDTDTPPVLRHLAGLLEEASGERLQTALLRAGQAAQRGLDLRSSLPALRTLARRRNPEVSERALHAVFLDALGRCDWGEVDRRLASRSPDRRRVVYQALRRAAGGDLAEHPEVLRRLVAGLAERDPEIRNPGLEQLRKAARAGQDVRAPGAILGRLGRLASDHPAYSAIQEYLFEAGVLQAAVPCPTCSRLGLTASWSRRDTTPAIFKELDAEGRFRFCRRCATAYTYSRVEDDRGLYLDWVDTLTRLSPRQAATELPPPYRPAAEESLVARRERARRDLTHPKEQLRREASWALAADALLTDDAEVLSELAAHRDVVVAKSALQTTQRAHAEGPSAHPAIEVLWDVLALRDSDVRRAAAQILARQALRDDKPEEVHRLLVVPDPVVLRYTCLVLSQAGAAGTDLAPFAARLGELTTHAKDPVRRSAGSALARAPANPVVADVRAARALQRLESTDPDLWSAGAADLATLSAEGFDVAAHLRLLVPGFSDPPRAYAAHQALASLLRSDPGATTLLPDFFAALRARPMVKMGAFDQVLSTLRDRNYHDPASLPDLLQALRDRRQNVPTMAFELLEMASSTTDDLAPYRARLLKSAPGLEGYMTERIGRFLGRIDRAAGDMESLAALLAHRNSDIRYGAMMAIEEGCGRGERLAAVIEALVACLGDRSDVHRSQAARHLRAVVGKRRADRARLRDALAHAPESREAEELKRWLDIEIAEEQT